MLANVSKVILYVRFIKKSWIDVQIFHFELFVTKIIICYKKYSFTSNSKWKQKESPGTWTPLKQVESCVPSILDTISPLPIRIICYKHNYLLQEHNIGFGKIEQSMDGTRNIEVQTSPHGAGTPPSPIHPCSVSLQCRDSGAIHRQSLFNLQFDSNQKLYFL